MHSLPLKKARYLSLVFTFLLAKLAYAEPLISADALQQSLSEENLVILDFQPPKYFQQAHIPGAINTDYSQWRASGANGLREMRPADEQLQSVISELGINNDSRVVIIPFGNGADDLTAAARIYWTLYSAGLDDLSILDKGLIGYYKKFGQEGLKQGTASPPAGTFKINTRPSQIIPIEKAVRFIEMDLSVVDARSPEEYRGEVSGSQEERPGAMPTAVNLPFDSLMNAEGDALADTETLRRRFVAAKAALKGPQLIYCHTGHRAALVWFVAHEVLGNENARLYDGSMMEWARNKSYPVETHLNQKTGS